MTGTCAITYLFDPLCGWCYGAGPALGRLAEAGPDAGFEVEIVPTGLFAGAGGRPMDDGFAAYAWANDQRIAALTGQPFSAAYRDTVLADRTRRFDSGPATLALTAVHLSAPDKERAALAAIQHARYAAGRDITDTRVLATILDAAGLPDAAARLRAGDAELPATAARRVEAGRALMRALGAQGVPSLVMTMDGTPRLLPGGMLFGRIEELIDTLTAAKAARAG